MLAHGFTCISTENSADTQVWTVHLPTACLPVDVAMSDLFCPAKLARANPCTSTEATFGGLDAHQ